LPAVGVAAVLALTVVARRQIGYWADNVTLWTHTIEITAPNYVAQDDLGGALMERKRMEDAIPHFRAAFVIHPVDPISALNIGFYEQQHGNLTEAIEWYKKAVILTTSPVTKSKALNNMGLAYRDLGNPEQARQSFDAAKKLQQGP
jgi:protein O-mannosyl-transferase